MEQLPTELIENILILETLDLQDVINVSLASKHFQDIIRSNNMIWKTKFYRNFPNLLNKFEKQPDSYYEELHHVYMLKRRARALLADAAQKLCAKVELSPVDLGKWEEIMKEKWDNYFYLVDDLMNIIGASSSKADTMEPLPINTPGNLTQKYYANKALRFIRQLYLAKEWKQYTMKKALLEEGVTIIAQWCQPNKEIRVEEIGKRLDVIAEMVKEQLRIDFPNHPLFNATKEQLELWKREPKPDNEWSLKDCSSIFYATNKMLFEDLGFKVIYHDDETGNVGRETCLYIDLVLRTRLGCPELLGTIYESVVRRLGVRCDPVIVPHKTNFLLRFCESQHPGADWYYIDVTNGGKMLKNSGCPFARRFFLPSESDKGKDCPWASKTVIVIQKLVKDLELMARESYSPSGKITTLRSVFELERVVNHKDYQSLADLIRMYMQYNFSSDILYNLMEPNELDDLQIASLNRMIENYVPEPEVTLEPVRRLAPCDDTVMYAIGMVMSHKLYDYKCVIFNWDTMCMAPPLWIEDNNICRLKYKGAQPFYNVLVEDDSHRYVAQENLQPVDRVSGTLRLDDKIGRYFSHYYKTHFVPNEQFENQFRDDIAIRRQYHNRYLNIGATH